MIKFENVSKTYPNGVKGLKNINLEMVKQGMAWAYKQYSHDPIYLQAQENAQAKRIGLWADNNPIEPSQWRRQEKNQYGF